MIKKAVLWIILTSISWQSFANDKDYKNFPSVDIINQGIQAYIEISPRESLITWLKDSPLLTKSSLNKQTNHFEITRSIIGSAIDSEYINIIKLTPRIQLAYLVIYHQFGPLYFRFGLYKTPDESQWIITSISFNIDIENIIPSNLVQDFDAGTVSDDDKITPETDDLATQATPNEETPNESKENKIKKSIDYRE